MMMYRLQKEVDWIRDQAAKAGLTWKFYGLLVKVAWKQT